MQMAERTGASIVRLCIGLRLISVEHCGGDMFRKKKVQPKSEPLWIAYSAMAPTEPQDFPPQGGSALLLPLGQGNSATLDPMKYVENMHLAGYTARSEEHTSELQSQSNLVCRLLL